MTVDPTSARVPASQPAPAQLPAHPRELFSAIHVLALPMRTRFRGITTREAMLVKGPAGWAEFSPFVEYDVPEAARWLAACIEFASTNIAIPRTVQVPVNATVPACPPAQVPAVLARYGQVGTVKIKIAEHGIASLPEDVARIEAVRACAPEASLRLDANAAYSYPDAVHAMRALSGIDLQYLEQPVPTVTDLARLRELIAREDLGIPLAADESIRKASDPLEVARLGAADVIIVKVAPLAGITAAEAVVRKAGLPAVVSSALDTSVGLAAGAILAARLADRAQDQPEGRSLVGQNPACGLGTSALFVHDVCTPRLLPQDGWIMARRHEPDEDALMRLAAPDDRQQWWLQRLEQCWDYLRIHN